MYRRQFIKASTGLLLSLLWTPSTFAQIDNLASIDHLEFFVSDLKASLDFYTRVFGYAVYKNRQTERRYLPLGSDYMAIEQRDVPRVDHFCIGIQDFDIGALHDTLAAQGIGWQDYPSGRDLRVDDPDGIRIQLAADNSWPQISTSTSAPEAYPVGEPAIFMPREITEIGLRISDVSESLPLYVDLFGEPSQRDATSAGFDSGSSRLRLRPAAGAYPAGVEYYRVLVSATDMAMAARAITAAGGRIERVQATGLTFLDPDGLRVVIDSDDQVRPRPGPR